MWKKLVIALISLLGSLSIGYTYFNLNIMDAASTTYQAGGNINGLINLPPSGVNGGIRWEKGDKIKLGFQNSSNDYINWTLFYNHMDQVWMCFTNESIASTSIYNYGNSTWPVFYRDTPLKTNVDTLNAQLSNLPFENGMLTPRIINEAWWTDEYQAQDVNERQIFIPVYRELNGLGLNQYDPIIGDIIWGGSVYSTGNGYWTTFGPGGEGKWDYGYSTHNVKAFAYWNLSKIVFMTTRGTSSDIGIVSNLKSQDMKIRGLNTALHVQLIDIENLQNNSISKIIKNSTVKLKADANIGNDGKGGIYTVSALVFDQSGNFVYYRPLEDAKGSGLYEFDLTGIPVGKYKIGIVNEAYNENTKSPAESSLISSVLPLEIVESVNIQAQPRTGL